MPKVNRTYTCYNGPSHGWMKVPTEDVADLGAHHFISSFSYLSPDGKHVWVEEDSDSVEFLKVAKIRGWDVTVNDKYIEDESRIRNYPSFDAKYVADVFIPWLERKQQILEGKQQKSEYRNVEFIFHN